MSDFSKDLLVGTPGSTLAGRTPDIGDPLAAPDIDLADGEYIQAAADNLLTAIVLQGPQAPISDVSVGTRFEDGALPDGTYYLVLVAVDAYGGMTAASNEVSVTATGGGVSDFELDATPVRDAVSYRIYYGPTSGGQTHYVTDLGYIDPWYFYDLTDAVVGTPPGVSTFASGGARVDDTIAVDQNLILEPQPTPPGADFFGEIVIEVKPTADSAYIGVLGRTSPNLSTPPNGVNFTGGYFLINGTDTIEIYRYSALNGGSGNHYLGSSAADYPDGPYTITLRVEFEGNQTRFIIDGHSVAVDTIVDSEFLAAGRAFMLFDLDTFTDDLSNLKLLRYRFGSLPESAGQFWTEFVKSRERDA